MKDNEFVFDTNALISALLLLTSVSKQALRKADSLGKLAFSIDTFEELRQVAIRTKFDKYLPIEIRLEFVERWELKGRIYKTVSNFSECRDKKDNQFLNIAVDSGACKLVTGDKALLELNPFHKYQDYYTC